MRGCGYIHTPHHTPPLHSEELGQPVQSVLLGYLRIILTEWAEPYEARAAAVMSAIANKSLVTDLFASLLKSKVNSKQLANAHFPLVLQVQPYAHQKVSFLLNFLREDSKSLASLKVEQVRAVGTLILRPHGNVLHHAIRGC